LEQAQGTTEGKNIADAIFAVQSSAGKVKKGRGKEQRKEETKFFMTEKERL